MKSFSTASKKYCIKYVQHGPVIRESTETENIADAHRMLRTREGGIVKGIPVDPDAGRITFEEAVVDFLNDCSMNGKKTLDDARRRIWKHLAPYFGNRRMVVITTADLRAYVAKRQSEGFVVRQRRKGKYAVAPDAPEERRTVSPAEINREFTVLKRMFSLAIQAGKLTHKPHFPMLRENNVRAGFLEHEHYLAMLKHLPACLRPVVTFAYITGWRINSEVLPMEWRQVDLKAGEVCLDPGTTKNLEGRVFYLTPEFKKLPADQRKAANRLQCEKGMIVQGVLFHDGTTPAGDVTFLAGNRIAPSGFYHAWCRARIEAGRPGSIPHDLRRTAVRNMVRAGIPKRVAMKLSGHKTRSVFDRYNIVSDADLRDATRRLTEPAIL